MPLSAMRFGSSWNDSLNSHPIVSMASRRLCSASDSLALATNNSAISAIGNDYGYEQIFARELQAIARPGDVFIAISTSGNSDNILAAVLTAGKLGVKSVAWTGQSGGKLRQLCECICIPSTATARIQECHILIGHIVCGLVEAAYFQHPETAGGIR